jgi:hypothetical protein
VSGQNWRTEVDATDYFGHQKKRVDLEQRRPVVRRASDLVGPGIGSAAIRVTDYNDVLATFNGYYSSAPGALNAPTDTESFIGTTVADPVLGGRQALTGLLTGYEYTRTFVRNASDPASISWGVWHEAERIPASATASEAIPTTKVSGQGLTRLKAPKIEAIGAPGTYEWEKESIHVLRPGVYTGSATLTGPDAVLISVAVQWPDRSGSKSMSLGPLYLRRTGPIPFTFWSTGENQQISVYADHSETTEQTITWQDFAITRVGDIQ